MQASLAGLQVSRMRQVAQGPLVVFLQVGNARQLHEQGGRRLSVNKRLLQRGPCFWQPVHTFIGQAQCFEQAGSQLLAALQAFEQRDN